MYVLNKFLHGIELKMHLATRAAASSWERQRPLTLNRVTVLKESTE